MARSLLFVVCFLPLLVGAGGCAPGSSGAGEAAEAQLAVTAFPLSVCSGATGAPTFQNAQVLVTAIEPRSSELLLSADEAAAFLVERLEAGEKIASQRIDVRCLDRDVKVAACQAERKRWQAVYTAVTDPPLSGPDKGKPCIRTGKAASVNVPAGSGRVVTILGYAGGCSEERGDIVGYARVRGVEVAAGETATVTAMLAHFGQFNCPAVAASFAARAFPSVGTLPDGRVVAIGGLTAATPGADNSVQLGSPAGDVHIYNPSTGQLEAVADATLQWPRAGAATSYVPRTKNGRPTETGWLALFGGTSQLLAQTADATAFPIQRVADAAIDTVELFDTETSTVVEWRQLSTPCTPDTEESGYCCHASEGVPCWRLSPDCADPDAPASGKCYRLIYLQGEDADMPAYQAAMSRKRVLPQASVMGDGHILVTGGGDWPVDMDAQGYRRGEIFWLREMSREIIQCPSAKCLQRVANADFSAAYEYGFQEPDTLPTLLAVRSGHTASFLGPTADGNYQYLFWGGTPEAGKSADSTKEPLAEVYVQSTGQDRGISGSVFPLDWSGDRGVRTYMLNSAGKPLDFSQVHKVYFHSALPLKPPAVEAGKTIEVLRFLIAGGLYYCDGNKDCRDESNPQTDGKWNYVAGGVQGPAATELYVVEVNPVSHTGAIWRIPDAFPDVNLGVGRYMHGAVVSDYSFADIQWNQDTNVTLLGGFTDLAGSADAADPALLVRYLRLAGETTNPIDRRSMPDLKVVAPSGDGPMAGRGALSAVALPDDTILLVGGLATGYELAQGGAGSGIGPVEVFAPTNIDIDFATLLQ